MSRDNQRAGHPLRTSPDQFPKSLPEPTRILNAALNVLIIEAGLTRRQVIAISGLDLTDKQCSRQMGERRSGPTTVLFEAILAAAAHELARPVEELARIYRPMLHAAQAAASGRSASHVSQDVPDSPVVVPELAPIRTPGTPIRMRTLAEKAEWLANLLVDNEEQRAAAELDAVFGRDDVVLVEVLVKIGALDPGMIAALLDEIRRRDGEPRSTNLFEAIRSSDEQTARRVAAVPLREELGRKLGILELDPVRLFGRRMAALILKGRIDQARREIVARVGELVHDSHNESLLAAIIEACTEGPALASMLLNVMVYDHREEMLLCLVQLLRHVRAAERLDLLSSLDDALAPEVRGIILLLLSDKARLPNAHGLDSPDLRDLATFMEMLRETSDRMIAVVANESITTFPDLAAGHMLESIPNLGPILGGMVAARFAQTVQLLARALADWNARVQPFNGFPQWYSPVKELAGAVLGLTSGMQLTSEMLTHYPSSGALLFDAMQCLNHPRFPVLLAELVANHVTVDALARIVVGADKEPRRLRIFEKLIKDAPRDADPIMRRIVTQYYAEIREVLADSGDHAPWFTGRMIELLSDQRSQGAHPPRRSQVPGVAPLGKLPSAHRFPPANRPEQGTG